jgi:hypothetical protein
MSRRTGWMRRSATTNPGKDVPGRRSGGFVETPLSLNPRTGFAVKGWGGLCGNVGLRHATDLPRCRSLTVEMPESSQHRESPTSAASQEG